VAEPWIETYTGTAVTPLNIKEDQIFIEDIAHALANQCRFSGHTKEFYSVAQHCVMVAAKILAATDSPLTAMCGLLHDASEAYIVDIPSPIKPHLCNYFDLERKVMAVIQKKFDLPETFPRIIKLADVMAVKTEQRDLMSRNWNHHKSEVFTEKILPMHPERAKGRFISMYKWLDIQRSK